MLNAYPGKKKRHMNTLKKQERLTKKSEFSALMQNGDTFHCYPFRVLWNIEHNGEEKSLQMKAGFGVPKKKFKKAVRRNKIRRRTKEAYRLHKEPFKRKMSSYPCKLNLFIIYSASRETGYREIKEGIQQVFQLLEKRIPDKIH
jgi:ribonuclease P protein component